MRLLIFKGSPENYSLRLLISELNLWTDPKRVSQTHIHQFEDRWTGINGQLFVLLRRPFIQPIERITSLDVDEEAAAS